MEGGFELESSLRSEDPNVVPIRVRNVHGTVICTVYIGPEAAIADPPWAHPHAIDARNEAISSSKRRSQSFSDNYWQDQGSQIQAARRLRDLSQQMWTIGSGATLFCTEGRHRSPSAAGAFLIDHYHKTPAEVVQLLRDAFATRERLAPDFDKLLSILTGYKLARDAGQVL